MTHTKKTRHPRFEPRTPMSQTQRPTCYPSLFLAYNRPRLVCIYTYIEIDVWEKLTKKRKQHLPLRDDASTAEAAPGRVGRDDQGEAHRANTTPNGGPHLELGLLLQEFAPCDWTTATALPAG